MVNILHVTQERRSSKDFYAAPNGTRPRDGPRSRSGSAPGLPRAQLTQHQFEFIDARVTRRLGNAPARPRAGSATRRLEPACSMWLPRHKGQV
jgi:hypothetical protein